MSPADTVSTFTSSARTWPARKRSVAARCAGRVHHRRSPRAGVTHLLTVGAYLSNTATQLASAIQAGITPIVFLYDNLGEGHPSAWRGNLLLNKVMGIEVRCFPHKPDESQETVWDQTLYPAVQVRKAELETDGHKVLVAAAGAIHPSGLAVHLLTYKEISEQSRALGFTPDYLYHTTGTGGVLPALVAGRLPTGGSPRIREATD